MSYLRTAKSKLFAAAKKFITKKEEGASMVEYGLLVALIAMVCIAAVTLLGTSLANKFNSAASAVDSAS
jgi:pilus assembly protein Flp/PilA